MSKTFRNDFFDEDDAEVALTVLDKIKEDRARRHFGLTDAASMHRPGYRFNVSDAAHDARRQAYADYQTELENAYLLPQQGEHTGAGSRGPRETRSEGDRCVIRGMDGHLQWVDGELKCVADARGNDSAMTDEREAAYAEYQTRIENAWRDGR
jgi:hypothetical protein